MTEEKRTPAFWRVVRYENGVREWWSTKDNIGRFSADGMPMSYVTKADADVVLKNLNKDKYYDDNYARAVPVYHRVVKKPKGHNVKWALIQMRAGKRVKRARWYVTRMGLDNEIGVLSIEDILDVLCDSN